MLQSLYMKERIANPSGKLLPSIKPPLQQFVVKAKFKQIFIFNARINYLMMVLGTPSIVIAILYGAMVPQLFIPAGITIVYFLIVLSDWFKRSIILDGHNVKRTGLLRSLVYPYEDIHKMILVRNLTHIDGRYRSRSNGMALLLFTTKGNIPGFPFFELGHQYYMAPEDLVKVFEAFDPADRIDIPLATRSDILNIVPDLWNGAPPTIPSK